MRIIGGAEKGRRLKAPKGLTTRPTADKVKEAVFNILSTKVIQSNFLDLFGGSGAIAIEAVSRGAARAVICEKDIQAFKIIKENVANARYEDKISILKLDAFLALNKFARDKQQFSLIYLDPPYYLGLIPKIMLEIYKKRILTADGLIITEVGNKTDILEESINFSCIRSQTYGDTVISLYKNKLS